MLKQEILDSSKAELAEASDGVPAIRVEGLRKRYGLNVGLAEASFEVHPGDVLALVGENGAGKSTLLRMLAGLDVPSDGRIEILGLDRYRDTTALKPRIAFLSDDPLIPSSYTPREYLELIATLYDVPPSLAAKQASLLLESFDLLAKQHEKVGAFSKGQYKKAAICGALISNAPIFLMDEPFTGGLDPRATRTLREILAHLSRGGRKTVIFSTQILDFAQSVGRRFALMHAGHIAAFGTLDEIREASQLPGANLDGLYDHYTSRDPRITTRELLETLGVERP